MACFRGTLAGALLVLALPLTASAELTGKERDQARAMIKGDLYLRTTIPMRFKGGRGWGGIGAEVLAEVSPTALSYEKNMPAPGAKTGRGVDTIYWGFGPNDIIRYGELSFKKGDIVDLWAEGVKPKDFEVMIRFVQIKTLDDFKLAFGLVLASRPLQDEHPEWAPEIRQAVAARKVIVGMTKAQAFAVVGTPIGVETGEDAGKPVEVWFPRQDTGASADYSRVASSTTGFPVSIRFVEATVVAVTQPGGSVGVPKR